MRRRRLPHVAMTQDEVVALWPKVMAGDADARSSIVEAHLNIILAWAERVDGDTISAAEAISKLSFSILRNMPGYRPTEMTFRQWLNRQKGSLWREIKRAAEKSEKKSHHFVSVKISDLPAPHVSESAMCCRIPTSSELALLLIPERDRHFFLKTLDIPMNERPAKLSEIAKEFSLTKQRISQIVCIARCLFRVYLEWIDCPRCLGRSIGGFDHHLDRVPEKHRDLVKKRIMHQENLLVLRAFIDRTGSFARAPFSMPKCC